MLALNQFDIVQVPFPFTDLPRSKRRPAVIVSSFNSFGMDSQHSVLAMVTSATHSSFPLDTPLENYYEAGLSKPCIIRMKLFTLDHRLIERVLGQLSPKDRKSFQSNLKQLIPFS